MCVWCGVCLCVVFVVCMWCVCTYCECVFVFWVSIFGVWVYVCVCLCVRCARLVWGVFTYRGLGVKEAHMGRVSGFLDFLKSITSVKRNTIYTPHVCPSTVGNAQDQATPITKGFSPDAGDRPRGWQTCHCPIP